MENGAIEVEWSGEVDSTNLVARRWIGGLDVTSTAGARAFVAQRQSAGVGRHGRKWHSPEGGLWCSIAWRLGADAPGVLESLGVRIGIACLRTVTGAVERGDVRLKWPNDVLIDGKKVCGCLVESFTHGDSTWLIIGVGINVANAPGDLPDALRTPPTAINGHRRTGLLPRDLVETLLREVSAAIGMGEVERARTFADAGRWLHGVGRRVVVSSDGGDPSFTGVLEGLSADGRLRVREEGVGADGRVLQLGAAIEYV